MHSIRSKIIAFTLLPLIVTLIVIGFLAIVNKQNNEKDVVANRLISYRLLLETGDLSFESLKDVNKMEVHINEIVKYAEILSKDHTVLYSSKNSDAKNRDEHDAAAINQAFAGIESFSQQLEEGELLLEYFSPLIINDKIVAVLRIELSYERTNQRILQYILFVVAISVVGILSCYIIISLLLTTTVLRNIDKLKAATLLIKEGDLDTPIESPSKDEIGDLASTLEKMRTEVKSSRSKLQTVNEDLEKQVSDRTFELQSKLAELGRLNRFMVDREVKMVELKKRIEELESTSPNSHN